MKVMIYPQLFCNWLRSCWKKNLLKLTQNWVFWYWHNRLYSICWDEDDNIDDSNNIFVLLRKWTNMHIQKKNERRCKCSLRYWVVDYNIICMYYNVITWDIELLTTISYVCITTLSHEILSCWLQYHMYALQRYHKQNLQTLSRQ